MFACSVALGILYYSEPDARRAQGLTAPVIRKNASARVQAADGQGKDRNGGDEKKSSQSRILECKC